MQNNKIIIGIAGANGSGKDTVGNYIVEKYGAKKLVFSDLLDEALSIFIDRVGRDDYAWLATILRKRFGEGILSVGMKRQIEKTDAEIIILSGVRDFGELDMVKAYRGGFLIYVVTSIEKRWERLTGRGEKADDSVSFEEFKEEKENLPSEKHIRDLGEKADFRIDNDGTPKDLKRKADEIMEEIKAKVESANS